MEGNILFTNSGIILVKSQTNYKQMGSFSLYALFAPCTLYEIVY